MCSESVGLLYQESVLAYRKRWLLKEDIKGKGSSRWENIPSPTFFCFTATSLSTRRVSARASSTPTSCEGGNSA